MEIPLNDLSRGIAQSKEAQDAVLLPVDVGAEAARRRLDRGAHGP